MKLQIIGPRRTVISRGLRSMSTTSEQLLWDQLRNRRLMGCKFRRQHPILNYVVDFYCIEKKLIIEVDGSIHKIDEVRERDHRRECDLVKGGRRIIRFTNGEICNNMPTVLQKIADKLR